MVTRVQLGNLVSNNGKTQLVGSESGLDSKAIIDALVEAKRVSAVRLEEKNVTIDERSKALTELRSILNRFKAATDVLRNPPGVGNASANIFQYRNTSLNATNGFVASNYVTVSAQPGAEIQSFNITNIDRIAREARQETSVISLPDATTASAVANTPTAGLFTAGTLTLRNVAGGADVSLTLNAGDSLQAVANRFNEVSDRTGFRANIIKVSDGTPNDDFKIIFTATKTGTTYGFDLNDPATVISDAGGVLSNVVIPPPSQTAQNARFYIDGIEITRETNAIDDVFAGLTFTLKQPNAAATSINVAVQPDTEIVQNAVLGFADVYNEFRLFVAKQTEIGENGLPKETALLANDSTLRSIISRVGTEISGVVAGIAGGNPSRLADVGLSFGNFDGDEENPFTRNILTVNTDKLSAALTANFNGTRDLFEFRLNTDNSNLTVFSRSNSLKEQDATILVGRGAGLYVAVQDSNVNTIQDTSILQLTDTTTDSAVRAVDGTNSLFQPGALTLKNVSGGADVLIDLLEGDTLEAVRDKFNAQSTNIGFSAAIVNAGAGAYTLRFTSNNTGTNGVFSLNQPYTVLDNPGDVFSRVTRTTTQEAIPETLMQRTVQSTGSMFVADLNTASAVNITSPAGDGLFRPGSIKLANINGGADVAISLTDGMTLDDVMTVFNDVSASTGISVSAQLVAPGEYQLSFSSVGFGVQATFDLNNVNTLTEDSDNIFQNITRTTTSTPALTSPRVSILEATTSSSGVLLTGAKGSVYEGLQLIYAAGGNAAVNVNMTQGLGDRVFNALDQILAADNGFLTTTLEQLVQDTLRNTQEVSKIDEQLITYRSQLEAQYTALEAALSRANNLLTLLDAQAQARAS